MDDSNIPNDRGKHLSKTPPGVPVATLSIRRDSFEPSHGKSRSMTCLLAAAASAAEIAGQPVLVCGLNDEYLVLKNVILGQRPRYIVTTE